MEPECLNTIGLILDIIGVILLFIFGLPNNVEKEIIDMEVRVTKNPEIIDNSKQYNIYKKMSRLALILLLIGFLCQILSNYI